MEQKTILDFDQESLNDFVAGEPRYSVADVESLTSRYRPQEDEVPSSKETGSTKTPFIKTKTFKILIAIIVVVLILVVAGLLIYFFIIKKKNTLTATSSIK